MELREIVGLMHTIDDPDTLYLLCSFSCDAGLFSSGGKLLFMARDSELHVVSGVETDRLQLQTHVRVSSVKNNQSFEDGYYNIIVFKNPIEEDENASPFITLCKTYADNLSQLDFKEFFYSLIDLFQLPSEQSYKDAVGLYGELKLIQCVQQDYSINISKVWHKGGSYSHYDFSGIDSCLEVKTTSSKDRSVLIKHLQLFDGEPCCLAVVCCDTFDMGETIAEVIASMTKVEDFQNIDFNLNLAKELKKVSSKDIQELRFITKNILFYSSTKINPFHEVPDIVTKLEYRLDVSECDNLDDIETKNMLTKLVKSNS